MPNLKEPQKEIFIKKSNALIEARYKLTLGEQRLILLLASYIHQDDEEFKAYEIRIADFAQMFDLKSDKSLYERVEQIATELLGKKLLLKNNSEKFEATVWLSYVQYVRGSGVVQLEFHRSLKPYLLQLRESVNGFTRYSLKTVMQFKSAYSIRLYELLKMEVWKARKVGKQQFEKVFTLEEYRLLLGIDKETYPIFAALRKWTIEPPVKEVSEQTELNITETRYLKTGRKITSLHFVVEIRVEPDTMPLEATESALEPLFGLPVEEEHPIVQKLMQCGFTAENARSLRHQYGIKRIERTLDYMHTEQSNGKRIVSAVSYLTKAIQEDWGQVLAQEKALQAAKRKQQEAADKQRKAQEQKERAALKKLHQQALTTFNQSPTFVKKMILDAFDKDQLQGNDFLREAWQKATATNPDAFQQSPMLCSTFTSFLVDKQFY